MTLCVWAGAALLATLPISDFTLAWTHSIEKIRWEEDWRISPAGLEIVEARIRGTGAGMEPPAGAELRDGIWHYHPAIGVQEFIELARSSEVPDYEFCVSGKCRTLSQAIPGLGIATSAKLIACPENDKANRSDRKH